MVVRTCQPWGFPYFFLSLFNLRSPSPSPTQSTTTAAPSTLQRRGRMVRQTQTSGHDFTQTQVGGDASAGVLQSSFMQDGGLDLMSTQSTQQGTMIDSFLNEPSDGGFGELK